MPPPLTFGLGLGSRPPVSQSRWMLRAARLFGFGSAWAIDHFLGFQPQAVWDKDFTWMAEGSPHDYYDYQTLLGYLARSAGKVQLGVGVTETVRRHPVMVAQAFMTLSHMTKVAPILGIGAGERENIEPYGLSFKGSVSRLEEALQIIRLCFESQGVFEFRGEFWNMPDAVMDLQPKPGCTPQIWVAAHGPRMLELAGKYGDGWYPAYPFSPDEYAAKLGVIRGAARSAGRDPNGIVPASQAYIVAARTEGEARAMLDHRGLKFMALMAPATLWAAHGEVHPLGDTFAGIVDFIPQRHEKGFLLDAIDQVNPEILAESVFLGTPTQIESKLGDLADAGLRHVMAVPAGGLVSKSDGIYNLRTIARLKRRMS